MNLLHIYSQYIAHTEAWVVGNREGLISLRNAIDAALNQGSASTEVTAADNESYKVIVIEAALSEIESKDINLPYTENYGAPVREHPINLIGTDRYRELAKPT